jgi:Fe-S cluster assembly ATPase SufC
MKKTIRAIIVGFTIIITMTSSTCDFSGFTSAYDCQKCQEAVDHMWTAINRYGCDENIIQRAVNRVNSDCGERKAQEVIDACILGTGKPNAC